MLNLFPFLEKGELKLNYTAQVLADASYGIELEEVIVNPEPEEHNPYYDYYTMNDPQTGDPDEPDEPEEEPEEPYNPTVENPCAQFGPNSTMADCGCIGGTSGRTECPPDPCDQTAQAAGTAATNRFNSPAVQTTLSNTPVVLPTVPPVPSNSHQNEVGFTIRKDANGNIYTSGVQTFGPNGGITTNYSDSEADYHTHTAGLYYAPSAQDLFNLNTTANSINGFTTRYVQASDGSKYALNIDDASKFNTFIGNNTGFVGSDDGFKTGTNLGDKWESTRLDLIGLGYTVQEAFTRATAFVLKESGVTLLKSNSIPDDFKKIDLEKLKNADGTPAKDTNGKNIYSKTDCN